ncbi:unnamed protein product [Microthlaspi erraticum]|uniref:Uncharacterized protein n=1 Tax=Microthlaspi erraticum TaxID=1685480 RepID=A0A6D2IBE5_9BRAS|nr:unnamed protein product [Microthlaspi erraticum]
MISSTRMAPPLPLCGPMVLRHAYSSFIHRYPLSLNGTFSLVHFPSCWAIPDEEHITVQVSPSRELDPLCQGLRLFNPCDVWLLVAHHVLRVGVDQHHFGVDQHRVLVSTDDAGSGFTYSYP